MQETTTTSVQLLLGYSICIIPLSAEEMQLAVEKSHPRLFIKKQFALQLGDILQRWTYEDPIDSSPKT